VSSLITAEITATSGIHQNSRLHPEALDKPGTRTHQRTDTALKKSNFPEGHAEKSSADHQGMLGRLREHLTNALQASKLYQNI